MTIQKTRADLEHEVATYRQKALAEHDVARHWRNRAIEAESKWDSHECQVPTLAPAPAASVGTTLPTLKELDWYREHSQKGCTRAKLAEWGLPWPPPKGWMTRLRNEAKEREGVPLAPWPGLP